MEVFALIIAGGVGARFWPRSREHSPKQLLEIIGRGSMLQNTIYRLDPVVPQKNVLVVTNSLQEVEVRKQLPHIPQENILIEPVGRNTAPAVTFGAEILRARHGDCIMIVLPADHLVHDITEFQDTILRAIQVAELSNGLVTIGINPSRPETGYGYIQYLDRSASNQFSTIGAYPVVTFAEKPNRETAQRFLESGDFLWNSGMFIWKVSSLLSQVAEFLPDISDSFHSLRAYIDQPNFEKKLEIAYKKMESISIDFGVMEKSANRYILPSDFGWNDLGSWDEVYRILPKDEDGNAIEGNVFFLDTKNCHIATTPKRYVGVIGVTDLTIIDTDDALLVYKRGSAQAVKEVVESLRKNSKTKFL